MGPCPGCDPSRRVQSQPRQGRRNFAVARPPPSRRLSDGGVGEHDFSDLFDELGPMIEPLRDPAYFARVVELATRAWPNGFDIGRHQASHGHGRRGRTEARRRGVTVRLEQWPRSSDSTRQASGGRYAAKHLPISYDDYTPPAVVRRVRHAPSPRRRHCRPLRLPLWHEASRGRLDGRFNDAPRLAGRG